MIQEMTYSQINDDLYRSPSNLQQYDYQNECQDSEVRPELKNSSKKQAYQLKFIKQLKSKDIKLSHKKIPVFLNKASSIIKNISSIENDNQIQNQISIQSKQYPSQQLKRFYKHRNYEIQEKQKIAVQIINNFNPEQGKFSKDPSSFNREKIGKKIKNQQAVVINHRFRQSRSQNKRQKNLNSNNLQKSNLKSSLMNHQNQSNIFQNFDFISKQNSHHSLDKNSLLSSNHSNFQANFKIQEKLHLPSLVGSSGLKNVKNKLHQNINLTQNNQTEVERHGYNADSVCTTQKSSPFIQKIVKIPIDRLKPLKPEQIKLKYQKKVKEQQKNRAKQMALQIFSKEEQQAEKLRIMNVNGNYDLESDENFNYEGQNRKIQTQEPMQYKQKTSGIKKQKGFSNSKGENIFKKHLMAFNGALQNK